MVDSPQGCKPGLCRGSGGPDRVRTDDLLDANQALSQLSYGPFRTPSRHPRKDNDEKALKAPIFAKTKIKDVFKNRIDTREKVDPRHPFGCLLLRKEVIQPQVLLQLPCYDFTPITKFTIET